MKRVIVLTAISCGLLLGSYVWAQDAAPEPTHATVAHKGHERHPELRKAAFKLRAAKADLEKAAHDYAGHRVKAIAAIDQALAEIKEAYKADKE